MDPKYHPSIIGRKGATIQKLREDHDVRVRLPAKEDANPDEITITGYEHQVNEAKEEILKIVQNLVRKEGGGERVMLGEMGRGGEGRQDEVDESGTAKSDSHTHMYMHLLTTCILEHN